MFSKQLENNELIKGHIVVGKEFISLGLNKSKKHLQLTGTVPRAHNITKSTETRDKKKHHNVVE